MLFNSNIENEIEDISMNRRHVVVLGAGASLAAFPNGDKYGNKLPLMNNFVDTLNLRQILESHSIKYDGNNFEEIYSNLHYEEKNKNLLKTIENKIYEYFSKLELPDYPTIYDHLVLSLRNKDLIATFNWDPFLFKAYIRNHEEFELPHIVFLHGNASIGYCSTDREKGSNGGICRKCKKPYTPSKLLYPIKTKNYNSEFIAGEWDTLKRALKNAYILTIFGYSAPKSDVEAISLMKNAWGDNYKRNLEEIELIDIKGTDELYLTWQDYIHSHHSSSCKDYYDSWIAKHPRRTCESFWNEKMELKKVNDNNIPKNSNFQELWDWFKPLKSAELSYNTN